MIYRSITPLAIIFLACTGSDHVLSASPTLEESLIMKLQELPNFPKVKEVRRIHEFEGQLFEVLTEGNNVFYANPSGTRLISGAIFEVPSARNLTAERQDELSIIDWNNLPLQDAIVIKKGDGSRKLAIFVDPNCQFCRNLEQEIDRLDNVTIYYLPLSFLGKDSVEKNLAIVCASNPAEVYKAWMKDGVQPPSPPENCKAESISRNMEFATIHGINGTPTIYFEDGSRIVGSTPAVVIEERLNTIRN